MSVHGVGIDVADGDRFARLLRGRGDGFAAKWFTDAEIDACRATRRPGVALASRYAAKEAVWKALGPAEWTGPLPWRGIEVVLAGTAGQPAVRLSGAAAALADRLGVTEVLVSIATAGEVATATAVATAEPAPTD